MAKQEKKMITFKIKISEEEVREATKAFNKAGELIDIHKLKLKKKL